MMQKTVKEIINYRRPDKRNSMRAKAIKALAAFLVLMILFTILSRVARQVTIPAVTITNPKKGTIDRRIEASGQVEGNQLLPVTTAAGLRVKTVNVREGERVSAKDVLFEVDMEDLAEKIQTLEEEIEAIDLRIDTAAANSENAENKRELEQQKAAENYNRAAASGNQTVASAYESMIAAQETKAAAAAAYDEAYADYQQKEEALSQALEHQQNVENMISGDPDGDYNIQKEEADAAAEKTQAERDTALQSVETSEQTSQQAAAEYSAAVNEYRQAVEANKDSLLDKEHAIQDADLPADADSTREEAEIEREGKARDLEKLRKIQENNGLVGSEIDAVVTKIGVSAGDATPEGMNMVLADTAAGVTFTAQISEDDRKYITRDDTVSLTDADNNVFDDLPVAAIQANEENSELYDVTVHLGGNKLEIGDSATMKFTKKSSVYNTCVPIAALHQENNQYYVLAVKTTDTVLGEETTAEKVEVTVKEKNAAYAALTDGALTSDQKVITDSDKEIEAGDRIRVEE